MQRLLGPWEAFGWRGRKSTWGNSKKKPSPHLPFAITRISPIGAVAVDRSWTWCWMASFLASDKEKKQALLHINRCQRDARKACFLAGNNSEKQALLHINRVQRDPCLSRAIRERQSVVLLLGSAGSVLWLRATGQQDMNFKLDCFSLIISTAKNYPRSIHPNNNAWYCQTELSKSGSTEKGLKPARWPDEPSLYSFTAFT